MITELEAIWRIRYPSRVLGAWDPIKKKGRRVSPDVVRVKLDDFEILDGGDIGYLFDIAGQRLIGAYIVSAGKNPVPRHGEPDKRLKGHPLADSSLYDRGHTTARTLGGGCDINIVSQNAKINRSGQRSVATGFRTLERRAVETPRSPYFVHWLYDGAVGGEQVPTGVEPGLLLPCRPPEVYPFHN